MIAATISLNEFFHNGTKIKTKNNRKILFEIVPDYDFSYYDVYKTKIDYYGLNIRAKDINEMIDNISIAMVNSWCNIAKIEDSTQLPRKARILRQRYLEDFEEIVL